MTPAALTMIALYGAGLATASIGAMMAMTAAAIPKRVMGLAFAFAGAALVATAMGASSLALAAAAASVGALLVGGAIAARIHEAVGTADWKDAAERTGAEGAER